MLIQKLVYEVKLLSIMHPAKPLDRGQPFGAYGTVEVIHL